MGPTSSEATGPYTVADYMALPEDGPQYELLDGRLEMNPSPRSYHQRVLGRLHVALYEQLERTGLGLVLLAPMDVVLDDRNVLQPDLLFVRAERTGIVRDRVHGPPDLVVEVLSPSTTRRDREVKRRLYARFGVPACWIVDPEARSLEALGLRGKTYRSLAVGRAPGPFSAPEPPVRLELDEVFPA